MTFHELGNGGATLSGSARIKSINSWRMGCHCNVFTVEVGGGIALGGTASLPDTRLFGSGGIVCSGSAVVNVPTQTLDNMLGWWLLQENQPPYVDLVRAKNGSAEYPPVRADGINCLYSQEFAGTEWIKLPDAKAPRTFSVSLWVNMDSRYEAKVYFSRGAFCFGHAYLNHLWARLDTEDEPTEAFSIDRLLTDRWYHVACSYDGSNLRLFINGNLVATETVTGNPTQAAKSAIGGWEQGGHPECRLVDVRLYGDSLGEAWWSAEMSNQCDPGFIYVGSEESVF